MEKVSIIIPVYNSEKTIGKLLYSVVKQTYHNLEIILVDDGSTDETYQVLENLKKKYHLMEKEIKLVRKQNGGASSARNVGITLASGSYLMFADADDLCHPDMVRSCMEWTKKRDYDLVVFRFIRKETKKKTVSYLPHDRKIIGQDKIEKSYEQFLKTGLLNENPNPPAMLGRIE